MNNNCPICQGALSSAPGDGINPKNGVMVWCGNPKCGMDCGGHGKTEKEAIEIFGEKCAKAIGKKD